MGHGTFGWGTEIARLQSLHLAWTRRDGQGNRGRGIGERDWSMTVPEGFEGVDGLHAEEVPRWTARAVEAELDC
jgi:hypothetical protein